MFWQIVFSYLVSCLPASLFIAFINENDPAVSDVEIFSMSLTRPIWVVRRVIIVAVDKFKGE